MMSVLANETSPKAVDASVSLLRQMITIRHLEQKALELSQSNPPAAAGSIHLCAGQEAVPVGALAALKDEDQVVCTYRGHGWALASGLSVVEVLGEICHRAVGINGGRGGSAYMMAPDRRFIGENSIVGAGLPIACGVALANRAQNPDRVVIVTLGDGAFNQGATHEGLAFAAALRLPIIIVCENNGWSEMTKTSDIFRVERIAQRASSLGMTGATINGTDPVVVRDSIAAAAEHARSGGGPTLIECRVPRMWGHYNRDIEHYRSKDDKRAAESADPIESFSIRLIEDGALTKQQLEDLSAEVLREIEADAETVLSAPLPDPATARSHVWSSRPPSDASSEGRSSGEVTRLTFIRAVNAALRAELESNPRVLVYGEDVGKAGGIFGAAQRLQKEFGEDRVFDTPISESAILGSAVGAAICGMKPIVEIMWADFMLVALDQLVNQAANVRYITEGKSGAPVVVRTQQGSTPGSCAQHSQCLEALLAHIPGLRIAVPATPQDAYSILRSAVAADDPCIVMEARSLYQTSDDVDLSQSIEPIGKARMRRNGNDAVIVTWGTMLQTAISAAAQLAEEDDRQIAVLDMRWLCPLDEDALINAVKASSGKVVILHEANVTAGFGAEILALVHERLSGQMTIRAVRVGLPDVRMPASPVLQQALLPNVENVKQAVRCLCER